MRKSGWDSDSKEEDVTRWFNRFVTLLLLQLVALSGAEGAVAPGNADAYSTVPTIKWATDSKENSGLILTRLSALDIDAAETAPQSDPGPLGVLEEAGDDTGREQIKLAKQHDGEKPAAAVGSPGSAQDGILSRMEPLRLRRAESAITRKTRLSPWLGALLGRFRIGGLIHDQYSTAFTKHKQGAYSNSYGASISASSGTYIWKPWFAVVGAGVGTSLSRAEGSARPATSYGRTGNALLMVFPSSRFPFKAVYTRRIGGAENSLAESLIGSESIQLSQRYQSRKNTHYTLTYGKTQTFSDSAVLGVPAGDTKIKVDERLNFNASRSLKIHRQKLSAYLNKYYDANSLDESNSGNVTVTDNFSTTKGVGVNSMANYNETYHRSYFDDGKKSEAVGKYSQFSSNAVYSEKNGRMSLNGSIRLYRQKDESTITENTGGKTKRGATKANGSVAGGVRYKINRNMSSSLSANASRALETDNPQPRYRQSASLSYGADPLEIGKVSYRWSSSARVSNSISSNSESTSADTKFGHSLVRPIYSGKNSNVSSNFSQRYSLSKALRDTTTNDLPATHSLSNNASLAGRKRGKRSHIEARLSLSDSRDGKAFESLGETASQVISFRIEMSTKLSPAESIKGALSSQYSSRQSRSTQDDNNRTSSGTFSYRNGSFFDIRGMSFVSTARISEAALLPYSGDDKSSRTLLWENLLEFATGRLRAAASIKWEEIDDKGSGTAFFRVSRSFGR